jgi:hypothetical protein
VLEYLEPSRALERSARWLRPGGALTVVRFLVTTYLRGATPS